jgi:hypothetical protein
VLDESAGSITLFGGRTVDIDPAAYWPEFDRIALALLLLCEEGILDRDTFFAPAVEKDA